MPPACANHFANSHPRQNRPQTAKTKTPPDTPRNPFFISQTFAEHRHPKIVPARQPKRTSRHQTAPRQTRIRISDPSRKNGGRILPAKTSFASPNPKCESPKRVQRPPRQTFSDPPETRKRPGTHITDLPPTQMRTQPAQPGPTRLRLRPAQHRLRRNRKRRIQIIKRRQRHPPQRPTRRIPQCPARKNPLSESKTPPPSQTDSPDSRRKPPCGLNAFPKSSKPAP